MVNHFASLLSNIDLRAIESVAQKYELVFGGNSTISAGGGTLSFGNYTAVAENKLLLPLVDRNYTYLALPKELQRIYNVLFPATTTTHYKQFLLYSYLRIVELTEYADAIKTVDSRISYSLDELVDYFKFRNISIISSNDLNYGILVYGAGRSDETSRGFTSVYTVSQQSNTATVLILSNTQELYYHPTKTASKSSTGMAVTVTPSADPLVSAPITIGDTGLTCVLGGKNPITATSNKVWRFFVDSPVNFSILDKIKTLDSYGPSIEAMFNYQQASCTQSYQNLWERHHSPVYRLAGLLLAYVERVNLIWQKRAT